MFRCMCKHFLISLMSCPCVFPLFRCMFFSLHTHLAGTSLSVHQYRNGVQLPDIDSNPHYDFNFQQTVSYDPPKRIYNGDELTVKCSYQSMDRDTDIKGGYGTEEEMCAVLLFYYPASP